MVITESARLTIRVVMPEDASAFEGVFCSPEVMRYSMGVETPSWVQAWTRESNESAIAGEALGLWAVVEKASGKVIGYCGLTREESRCGPDEAEIGYRLVTAAWGRGYGREAAQAVCRYGFATLRVAQILAIVDPNNEASIRLLRAIGMTYVRDVMFEDYDYPDHVYVLAAPPTA